MTTDMVVALSRQAIELALFLAMPMLAVSLIVGVFVSVLQAATQIQEMTLTFVPKVGAMLMVFWASMSFMSGTLVDFFQGRIIPMIVGG